MKYMCINLSRGLQTMGPMCHINDRKRCKTSRPCKGMKMNREAFSCSLAAQPLVVVGDQSCHYVLCYERNVRCAGKHLSLETGSHSCQTFTRHPPVSPGPAMERGWTTTFLALALLMDIVGLILFFVGIFAPLSFWDFFVLSGPVIIFLSLVLWIFWYLGNLTVSDEELNLTKHDV